MHSLEDETNAPASLWAAFIIFIIVLLYVDLFVASPSSSKSVNPLKQAMIWTVAYVCMALCFCVLLLCYFGMTTAEEFLAGYLIEKSLSVDNLFVMILTFKMFRIRKQQQKELLVWGIIGAIIMRAVFILAGSWILHHFSAAMYVFGIILIVAALKMVFSGEENEDEPPAVANLLKRVLPWDDNVSLDGDAASKFFVRSQHDGKLKITPQFACLIVIEVGDVIFAVDSIPAIFAVTEDPFVVFTSNIFAILGLRAMYFVISTIISKFEYLQYGLAAILGFVGVKMLIADWIHIPTWASLVFILGTLLVVALLGKIKGSSHNEKAPSSSFEFDDNFGQSSAASMV